MKSDRAARALPKRLTIDGVELRTLTPEDAAAQVEAVNESLEHLRPWMEWAQAPAREEDAALRLALAEEAMNSGGDGTWGIFDAASKRLIGGCGLHDRVGPGGRDVGYWLHPDWTGKGIATRTAAAMTRVGFEYLELDRVEIRCDVANVRSSRVAARLGFEMVEENEAERELVWLLMSAAWPVAPAAQFTVVAST